MNDHQLDMAGRLEAHALIDHLVADGETFARSDTWRLIALLPLTKVARFSFTGMFKSGGGSLKGHAAGVGPVEMKEEPREKRVSLNAPAIHRIGGYEVTHTSGHIGIDLMWHQTRLDRSGQSCALIYDVATGEPKEDADLPAEDSSSAVREPVLCLLRTLEGAAIRIMPEGRRGYG